MDELSAQTNLYDIEKDFSQLWQKLGESVFEKQLGKLPSNLPKKNLKNTLIVFQDNSVG